MGDRKAAIASFVGSRIQETLRLLGEPLAGCGDRPRRRGPLDIAIPVFNGSQALKRCLDSVLSTLSPGDRLFLLDDASDDPEIPVLANDLAARWGDTTVLKSQTNRGIVESANRLLTVTTRDVVLMNSDTIVAAGWLEYLQEALSRNRRAGLVCPVSNNATILSAAADAPFEAAPDPAARLWAGNPRLPTTVGFCTLISRDLIDFIGLFDPAFSPGYGEENDLSMRALKAGFEIVAADRAVVFHSGGGSFDAADSRRLKKRNRALLHRRWPEYASLVKSWWRDNPLREKTEELARSGDARPSVLHVLHRQYHIGGTERLTRALINQLSNEYYQTLIYPGETDNAWCDIETRSSRPCRELMLNARWIQPKIRIAGHPADLSCPLSERSLARVVRGSGSDIVHFHHLLNWDSVLLPVLARRLGKRVVISVHDFFINCPIYNQLEYATGLPCQLSHCGADKRCERCLGEYSDKTLEADQVRGFAKGRQAVMERSLKAADAIVVPSHFLRAKIAAAYPSVAERMRVIPHGTEVPDEIARRDQDQPIVLGYFGGDMVLKGARLVMDIMEGLQDLPITLRVYGRIKGFEPSSLPANVELHGFFNPGQIGRALSGVSLTLVPSTYEESYSMIVTESWAHGVPVMVSGRGALSERVSHGVNGWIVPELSRESWQSAIRKLLASEEMHAVSRRLDQSQIMSMADCAQNYAGLYRGLLGGETDSADARHQVPTRPEPAEFRALARELRGRGFSPKAPWRRRRAKPPTDAQTKAFGLMRDRWGTAEYRVRAPLLELATRGRTATPVIHVVKEAGLPSAEQVTAMGADRILVQPFISDPGLNMMEDLARCPDLSVIMAIDDLWTGLPDYNPVRRSLPADLSDRLRYAASLADRIVFTTPLLAAKLGFEHPDRFVIENALPPLPWTELKRPDRPVDRGRPRVGWAGAPQHLADLELLEPVVRATRDELDWVFLGMCPDSIKPMLGEFHAMRPFADFPEALASAALDVAVAPLAINPFNRCKSHLKVLEYGILGIPVVATAIDPYLTAPISRIEGNDTDSWITAVRELALDSARNAAAGQELRRWITQNHLLASRADQWSQALGNR